MKRILYLILAMTFFAAPITAMAGDVEFVSTGEGDKQVGRDAPEVDDPYKGKPLPASAEAGHPLTQKSYDAECKDDLCDRAEKRQTSEGTTWKDDEGKLRGNY